MENLIAKYHLRQNADLSSTNWFRVGGRAEYLFRPENIVELAEFLAELPSEIPVTVLGVGSNIIIRDGGIDGVVVKLGRGFTTMIYDPKPMTISVGAATLDLNLAQFAAENSIAGLEFLSGIPGTIGGAVRMNAGAYGADISQVLESAEIVTRDGKICELSNDDISFSYRKSTLPQGAIVTKAVLHAITGDKEEIVAKIDEIKKARAQTQPSSRTGGSTFKNPPQNQGAGAKAWELIDQAGCRGLMVGGAQVSEKHCNFLINTGSATAADLENLGEEVIKRVFAKTGILLEWEIKRIGNLSKN